MVAINDIGPLATPAQLENFTKGKLRAADLRVPDALAAVSRSIRNRAGWHITPLVTDHALVLDGPGGRVLALPSMHIKTIHTLDDDGALYLEEDLRVSRGTGLTTKRSGAWWSSEYGAITVTMDHGHDVAEDLVMMCMTLAARGLSSPMGATREQAGALSVNWGMTTQGVAGGIVPSAGERTVMDYYTLVRP